MTRRVLGSAGLLLAVLCAGIAQRTGAPAHAAELGGDRLPSRLAETGLYSGDGVTVDPRNLAFSPQYPLWTDGLHKRRWIYLPAGAAIDGRDEHDWRFPVGTKFWKEFSLNGRKVETRLLWKTAEDLWSMASYVWSEDGREATLAPVDGVLRTVEVGAGRYHSIPSRSDCAACHGATKAGPLGFTALQLSSDRDPNAIHGTAVEPGMATTGALIRQGLLQNARPDLLTKPPRITTSDPATRAVLGYMVGNCSMCHNGKGEIAAVSPVIRAEQLVADGDAVARSFVGTSTRWQMPGVPDGESVLVHAGSPKSSVLIARMRSRSPSSQMPPLGTVIRDEQAVEAITRWIESGPAPVRALPAAGEPRRR